MRGIVRCAPQVKMHLMNSSRIRAAVCALGIIAVTASTALPAGAAASTAAGSTAPAALLSQDVWDKVELNGLDARVFALALQSAAAAVERGAASLPSTLTVIDYSKPSTVKRMWVLDVRPHAVLFHELVSHGRGSGKTMATTFSNAAESNMTSLG